MPSTLKNYCQHLGLTFAGLTYLFLLVPGNTDLAQPVCPVSALSFGLRKPGPFIHEGLGVAIPNLLHSPQHRGALSFLKNLYEVKALKW